MHSDAPQYGTFVSQRRPSGPRAAGAVVVLLGLGLGILGVPAAERNRAQVQGPVFLANLRKPQGNLTFAARWRPERGVTMIVREKATPSRQAILRVTRGEAEARRAASSAPNAPWQPLEPVFVRLGNLPKAAEKSVRILVKFRPEDWQVYVNERFVCKIPAPFSPPARAYVLPDARPREARFQPVGDETFHSDFMIEQGAPNPLYPWTPQTGTWKIHTAQEDALASPESDLDRVKKVPLTPDKSPNFYSLVGFGKDALITTGYDFYDEYSYAASVHVDDGEAGIVFYHRDNKNYYAFTTTIHPFPNEGGFLALWRMRDGEKTVLARVGTKLFTGQWYQLRVEVGTDRIECFLDNIKVASVHEPLPPGGRIGLYANTAKPARFDDAKLDALQHLHLRDVEHVRFFSFYHDGRFYRSAGFLRRATPDDQTFLDPDPLKREQVLVLGRPVHRGVVFSARFLPKRPTFTVGLAAGFTGPSNAWYRFRYTRTPLAETFGLDRMNGKNKLSTLSFWEHPLKRPADLEPVVLMADASTPGELRLYRNGELVLFQELGQHDQKLQGGAGLVVGPRTDVEIHDLRYEFRRRDLYKEKRETNKVFEKDPFMRHWASPEGQWTTDKKGQIWHKGDFFGRFEIGLPIVDGAEIHAGVPDDATEGMIHVHIKQGTISLALGQEANPFFARKVNIPKDLNSASTFFTLCYEGYWVWVKVGGQTLVRARLTQPLSGTHVWIRGFQLQHLAQSRVARYNVKDDLFSEAPHDWISHGGKWRIINRFQCTPSWSHMIGESAVGLAALWHKYIYGGDFTLEFYAGIRHGWYQRPGDLNCTAMAAATVPGSGYTVTNTEYDPNLSENWTSFYKNGKRLLRTDKYLVPRRRKGYLWPSRDPLVAPGRPIHGAWYYIKLRRIGNKIEYYFDNQLVFRWEDPDPIPEGLIGIWTFMQSMTVARVKIAFRSIRPRPFEFHPLPPTLPAAAAKSAPPRPRPMLTADGMPLDSLRPSLWSVQDDAGHSRLLSRTMNAAVMGLENQLGGGRMFLQSSLPPLPLSKIAGWRFQVRCTPGARLNFHYSVGRINRKGQFTVYAHYVHRLNGFDFSDGEYTVTGKTDVEPVPPDAPFHQGWRTVTVWIPSRYRHDPSTDSRLLVRVDGFGLLQPSYYMAGLYGNFPGEAWAVRQFTPVLYGVPDLSVAGKPTPARIVLRRSPGGEILAESSDPDDIERRLSALSKEGLNSVWIQIRDKEENGWSHDLFWLQLPERIEFRFGWHPERPEAVILENTVEWPDPRFAGASIRLAGAPLTLLPDNRERRTGILPRTTQFTAAATPELVFAVDPGTGPVERKLRWQDRRAADRPVLTGLKGLTPFCITCERDGWPQRLASPDPNRHSIRYFAPEQGRVLHVRNRALEQRLTTVFSLDFPLSRFPLFQFRYNAGDMVHVTAAFAGGHYVRLADDYSGSVQVRYGSDISMDQAWHSWIGFITDAFVRTPFSAQRFHSRSLTLGSVGSPDQTGRYSAWDIDDLVFGPAVRTAEELACTPEYYDRDGIREVQTTILAGPEPWAARPAEQQAAAKWQTFKPGQRIVPDLGKLQDGVYHLLFRAVDGKGTAGPVTDIPFLLDRAPLTAQWQIEPDNTPALNGVHLRIDFNNGGGAPLQISKTTFSVGGRSLQIPSWTNQFVHSSRMDRLILNYPLILRPWLDKAKNGDVISLVVDNIMDGAGNPTPPVTIQIPVDYAKDKTGPSWHSQTFGKAVHWFANWDGVAAGAQTLSVGRGNGAAIIQVVGASPFFQTTTYYSNGDAYRTVNWKPAEHPWLAFRARMPSVRRATRFTVVLDTSSGTYIISLQRPTGSRRDLNRYWTFHWTSNKWLRFCFNVRDLLRNTGLSDAQINNLVVRNIFFRRRHAKHAEVLQLDDIFIFSASAPAANDILRWAAFDASGVSSLVLTCRNAADVVQWQQEVSSREVNLHELRARAAADSWLECRAKDKAGNLSTPFWIPFPKSD